MAELTEMRITGNNAAAAQIMQIQGQPQEATVESAEHRAPDRPGADASVQWPCGRSQGALPAACPAARAFGCRTCAVCMVGCLCPSAWQEGKQQLLRARFGCHCCQEEEALSCQHNYLCFSHPPFLIWQLSAYHSARCQGNHHGAGWARNTGLPQPQCQGREEAPGTLQCQDPPGGRVPWASSPEVLLKADHCSFLLHERENQLPCCQVSLELGRTEAIHTVKPD